MKRLLERVSLACLVACMACIVALIIVACLFPLLIPYTIAQEHTFNDVLIFLAYAVGYTFGAGFILLVAHTLISEKRG